MSTIKTIRKVTAELHGEARISRKGQDLTHWVTVDGRDQVVSVACRVKPSSILEDACMYTNAKPTCPTCARKWSEGNPIPGIGSCQSCGRIGSCQSCGRANYQSQYSNKEVDALFELRVNSRGASNMTSVFVYCADCLKALRAVVFPFSA